MKVPLELFHLLEISKQFGLSLGFVKRMNRKSTNLALKPILAAEMSYFLYSVVCYSVDQITLNLFYEHYKKLVYKKCDIHTFKKIISITKKIKILQNLALWFN